MEPHGQSPWFLINAPWGDIPRLTSGQAGQKMAYSSTAEGRACAPKCVTARRRGFLLPG